MKARPDHLLPIMGNGFGHDALTAAMNARPILLWPVIRHVRRWYWRRRFAALDRFAQGYARFLGIDPETLIERGEL